MPRRRASCPRSRKCSYEFESRRYHPRRVVAIEQVTPLIKHFTFAPIAGELPAFSGGSHIIVVMRGADRVHRNPYSLLSSPNELDNYEIGVRRMEESRGGSHFMHEQVQVGTGSKSRIRSICSHWPRSRASTC